MAVQPARKGPPTLVSFDWAMKSIARDIQETREKLNMLKGDEAQRRAYEKSLVASAIQMDILQTAYDEGKAEGQAEGKAEAAQALLQKGLSPTLVQEVIGLSAHEIDALTKAQNV